MPNSKHAGESANASNAPEQPRIWFWASLVAFFLLFLGTAGLILFAPRLAQFGMTGSVFYLVVITAGLFAAAFLFGALRSYARYEGKAFNGTLELGGPVVLFCLVVLGAFYLPKGESTFSLIVRVTGAGGPSDVIKKGTITVDFGTDRRTKDVGSSGEAYFNEVPMRFVGSAVEIIPNVPNYQMLGDGSRQIPDTHVIYLQLSAAPVSTLVLRGRVVSETGQTLESVVLSVAGDSKIAQTDARGNFALAIARGEAQVAVRLRAEKDGSVGFDDYVTPPGPLTITFKGKTE